MPDVQPQTTAVTGGRADNGDALAPVIWATSAFEAPDADAAASRAGMARVTDFYTRFNNPTVEAFASTVAELEGAEAGVCFGSGMGAVTATVLGLCSTGGHVVAQRQLFTASSMLFQVHCARFGIDVTMVDGADTEALVGAVQPGRTQLVFVETPSNPGMVLVDLDALGAIKGPVTVCDSTFATPLAQRPLEHGVDLVVHSATKSLAGHNDATLGVVLGERELVDAVWRWGMVMGSTASPYDAANALRGLRTLGVRVRHQHAVALDLAERLQSHPAVAAVHHPGLPSHPQHELAQRQMTSFGSCFSFDVVGGREPARRFVDHLSLARLAPSLGGPETLVNHPASMTHRALPPEEQAAQGIGEGMIRISIGLEDPIDIAVDLFGALDKLVAA
jgi:cystathionine beta-lyase/cystathionine gamma-synthase